MSQSYLCCCFSCNFILPFLLSCSLLISLHLHLLSFLFLYCPLSLTRLFPIPSSPSHHPRLLLLHYVLLQCNVGNFRKWSRILMMRYIFHNLSTFAFYCGAYVIIRLFMWLVKSFLYQLLSLVRQVHDFFLCLLVYLKHSVILWLGGNIFHISLLQI